MNDVCLLLEGTYPYVSGGVSSWVYNLIKSLPNTTFSIVYIGPHRSQRRKMHYEVPHNVREFRELYLFDYQIQPEKLKSPNAKDYQLLYEFMRVMQQGKTDHFDEFLDIIGEGASRSISLHDLVHSKKGWKLLEKLYRSEPEEVSFIDYFWTWRFLYVPFYSLMRASLPEAKVYHCASTGYAGILGAVAKRRTQRPLLLTEHGIYTRERKIEIAKADWIYSDVLEEIKVVERRDFFKEWWVNLFSFFSLVTYERADRIFTLYDGNRRIQIEEGADPEKLEIVPNGVDLDLFQPDFGGKKKAKPVVGFVGRVVPIKDVKTLIRAFKIVKNRIEQVELWILGPTDEDEEYYEECSLLARTEGLEADIHFMGKVNLKEFYPKLDVIVLTSISEGQPLVILEGHACGVPVVATDVGSCSELLYGKEADDRLLGKSGIVTPIRDPEGTADGIVQLLRDEELRKRMGKTGRLRVERYYQNEDVLACYQRYYDYYKEDVLWPV